MNKTISIIILSFIIATFNFAHAEKIHKWIDANGITHYSDEAPVKPVGDVILIELPASHTLTEGAEINYYSIFNQWKRVHQERIVREQIKLEKAKLQSIAKTFRAVCCLRK